MTKPLVGVIKDTHLTSNNIALVTDIFQQFIDLLKKLKVDKAIHLGDFFTNRAGQDAVRLNAISNILDLFETAEIELYAIQGNHDLQNLESNIGYMNVYKKHPNFHLYDTYRYQTWGRIKFHFLSYLLEGQPYLDSLAQVQYSKNDMNILCTHIAINGVRNNDGSVVTTGIPVVNFASFDKVLVGHYHDDSYIKPNIYYIEGAYQMTFGESLKKGFTIVNDDGSLKFYPSKFPEYHKLKTSVINKAALAEIQQDLAAMDLQGKHVRLILTGSAEEIESIDVKAFKEMGVDVRFENTKETAVDFEEIEELELITFSTDQLIQNYEAFASENQYTDARKAQGLRYMKTILR